MAAGAGLHAVEDDLLKCLINKNVLDDAAQPTCIKRFIEGNAEPVALLCDRVYRGMIASSAPSSSSLLVKAVNEIGRDVTAAHFARLDHWTGQYQSAHWLLATKTNDGYCIRFKVLNFHHHISSENAAALHFYECGKERDAQKSPFFVARIKVLPKPKTDQVPLPDPKWTSQELVEWLKANEDYYKAVDQLTGPLNNCNAKMLYAIARNPTRKKKDEPLESLLQLLSKVPRQATGSHSKSAEECKIDWQFFSHDGKPNDGYTIDIFDRDASEFALVSRTVAQRSKLVIRLTRHYRRRPKFTFTAICRQGAKWWKLPVEDTGSCLDVELDAVTVMPGTYSIVFVHEDDVRLESEVILLTVIERSPQKRALLVGPWKSAMRPKATRDAMACMEIILRHEFGFAMIDNISDREINNDLLKKLKSLEDWANAAPNRIAFIYYVGDDYLHGKTPLLINNDFVPCIHRMTERGATVQIFFDVCFTGTSPPSPYNWPPWQFHGRSFACITSSSRQLRVPCGSLTSSLYAVLQTYCKQREYSRCDLSCESILYMLRDHLRKNNLLAHPSAVPLLVGDSTRTFGDREAKKITLGTQHIVVSMLQGGKLHIVCGRMHAMTTGVYELCSIIDGTSKALVEVRDVYMFDSIGRVISRSPLADEPQEGDLLYYKHPLVGFVQSAESDLSMPVIVRGAESKVVTEMHAMLAKYPRYLAPTIQEPANLEHIQLSYQNDKWKVQHVRDGLAVELLTPREHKYIHLLVPAIGDAVCALRCLDIPLPPAETRLVNQPQVTLRAYPGLCYGRESRKIESNSFMWRPGESMEKTITFKAYGLRADKKHIDSNKEGDRLQCEIYNQSDEPIYVAAFFFSSDGERTVLDLEGSGGTAMLKVEPKKYARQAKRDGNYISIPDTPAHIYRAYFGAHSPYVDVVVVIATNQPVHLDGLLSLGLSGDLSHAPDYSRLKRGPPHMPHVTAWGSLRWQVIRMPYFVKPYS